MNLLLTGIAIGLVGGWVIEYLGYKTGKGLKNRLDNRRL